MILPKPPRTTADELFVWAMDQPEDGCELVSGALLLNPVCAGFMLGAQAGRRSG